MGFPEGSPREAGEHAGHVGQVPRRGTRLPAHAPDRHSDVESDQPSKPVQHEPVSQAQVLGIVRPLPKAVAPPQRDVFLRPAPGPTNTCLVGVGMSAPESESIGRGIKRRQFRFTTHFGPKLHSNPAVQPPALPTVVMLSFAAYRRAAC